MNPDQKTTPIASHFQTNYARWDRLDCRAFLDILTDLLTTFSTCQEWESLPLYQKWLRHRHLYRMEPSTDEPFTMGDYYQLVTALTTTLETLGIQ